MNRRRQPLIVVALGLSLLLAACSSSGGGGASGSPGAGGGGGDGDIGHPTGATDVVLRMATSGGFVMPEFLFSAMPAFTLYGDGTVIVPGAQDMIFPGPALPPLQARRLSEAGIQQILAAVAETGLFVTDHRYDGAAMTVADAPDTVFTLTGDGPSVEISIYGLGTLDPQNLPQGIAADEVAAHQRLLALSNLLSAPDPQLGADAWLDEAWHRYVPTAFRLSVRSSDADVLDGTETFVPWPIEGEDPAAFGALGALPESRCGVVTGDAAATWLEVLSAANQMTRFTADEHRYAVTPRPLLPDEEPACIGA